jgi:RHS repeat-associated protein
MSPGVMAETDLAGTIKSEYVFFDGERVARRDGATGTGGVFYYFSDHLKTASVITDSAGVIKADSDYYPWGGELQFVANDSNDYKFTGKKRDLETGLDYFGARYYSNGLGRFVTPDWAAKATAVPYAEFADPQSLNLYTYVRNIPTSKADRDGHCLEDACVVEGGIAVSFLVIATAQYLSLPSSQRSLRAAGEHASSVIRGWFHKTTPPPSMPAPQTQTGAPASEATTTQTGVPASTTTTVETGTPASTSQAGTVSTNTAQTTNNNGTIYVVPGSGTKSGRPYVGRHNKPNPAKTRRSNDGRDRTKAKVVDTYPANNPPAGADAEQQEIDRRGDR